MRAVELRRVERQVVRARIGELAPRLARAETLGGRPGDGQISVRDCDAYQG